MSIHVDRKSVLTCLSLPLQGSVDSNLHPLTGKIAEETNERRAETDLNKMPLRYSKVEFCKCSALWSNCAPSEIRAIFSGIMSSMPETLFLGCL